jgi:hypothetical protein
MKPSSLLIDNWTLQCVGTLLSSGLAGDTSSELDIAPDLSGCSYNTISQDALNTRCLFQTINHLVFTDLLLVEKEHADTGLPPIKRTRVGR